MIVSKNFGGANDRRYARPWGAIVTLPAEATRLKYQFAGSFTGSVSGGGRVEIGGVEIGSVVSFGQKDLRSLRGSMSNLYVVESGEPYTLRPISDVEALDHLRAQRNPPAPVAPKVPAKEIYLLNTVLGTFKVAPEGYDEELGSEDCLVQVEEIKPGMFHISVIMYYERDGIMEMTITQPRDRAIKTFLAAVTMDGLIQIGDV